MADKREEKEGSSAKSDTEQNRESPKGEAGIPTFPVIGIGASAGGLEALKGLFEAMPPDTGAAFVVVQHLAPSKESAMVELLGRHTRMPVYQVTNNMEIRPNTVYIIPPEKNISIEDGTLRLLEQTGTSGIRHPIDFFFKSLARDRGAGAVGVILSGTGTDGTDGARAIKAELGLVIAQDPDEAKYDGMPQSVIDRGLADLVSAAEDIPDQVVKYIRHIPDVVSAARQPSNGLVKLLPKIVAQIRNETGLISLPIRKARSCAGSGAAWPFIR